MEVTSSLRKWGAFVGSEVGTVVVMLVTAPVAAEDATRDSNWISECVSGERMSFTSGLPGRTRMFLESNRAESSHSYRSLGPMRVVQRENPAQRSPRFANRPGSTAIVSVFAPLDCLSAGMMNGVPMKLPLRAMVEPVGSAAMATRCPGISIVTPCVVGFTGVCCEPPGARRSASYEKRASFADSQPRVRIDGDGPLGEGLDDVETLRVLPNDFCRGPGPGHKKCDERGQGAERAATPGRPFHEGV